MSPKSCLLLLSVEHPYVVEVAIANLTEGPGYHIAKGPTELTFTPAQDFIKAVPDGCSCQA